MIDRNKLKFAIIQLLELGSGVELNFYAMLSIDQLEDGRWRIFNNTEVHEDYETRMMQAMGYDSTEECEEIYDHLEVAVDRYLDIRERHSLGLDCKENFLRENDEI